MNFLPGTWPLTHHTLESGQALPHTFWRRKDWLPQMTLLLQTWQVRVNQQWLPRKELCMPWGTHRTRGWTVPVSTMVINPSISNPEPITRFPEISKRVGPHLEKAALHNENLFISWHSPFSTSVEKVIFPNSFILCHLWWMSSKNVKQMGETFQKENEASLRYF